MNYESWKSHFSHEGSVMTTGEVTGTVFTPHDVAKLMVFVLLINDFNQNAINSEMLREVYLRGFLNGEITPSKSCSIIYERLRSKKLLDLSCGSGILIFTYLEFMDYLLVNLDCDRSKEMLYIIEKNIYVCDIDPHAIHAFEKVMQAFILEREITRSDLNIYLGNSLIDPWPFKETTFDFIIGNPPYIGEKGNLEWFEVIKSTPFGKKYYEGKMDYFYFFIYRGFELLSQNGSLCYLTSNYFFTADGAKKLREFIRSYFPITLHVDYENKQIFPERKLHACVNVFQKQSVDFINVYNDRFEAVIKLMRKEVQKETGTFHFILSHTVNDDINKMSGLKLGDFYRVNQGIVTGYDRYKTEMHNKGVFVLSKSEAKLLPANYRVPFYKNSDIAHYYCNRKSDFELLYLTDERLPDSIIEHLTPYKEKLEKRREVQKGIRKWFQLTWPRNKDIFTGEKIVAPQRAQSNRFAYHVGDFYASADVYFITSTDASPYDLKILTLLLNAKPYYFWLKHMGKRKGDLLELYATPLKNLPLPILDAVTLEELKNRSDLIFNSRVPLEDEALSAQMEAVDRLLNHIFFRK